MVMGLPGYLAVVQRQRRGVRLPCDRGGVGMVSLKVAYRALLSATAVARHGNNKPLHSLRAYAISVLATGQSILLKLVKVNIQK